MSTGKCLREIRSFENEKGAVLVVSLLIVLLLTILSLAAMMNTTTELKIAGNDRSSKRVFYTAEAGTEDARSRLQTVGSSSPIPDDQPTNANWTAFIGTPTEAALQGYVAGNSDHVLYSRLPISSLDYVVTIKHKLDASGQILKWGYSTGSLGEYTSVGNNIFVIESKGQDTTGALKSVQIEATNTDLYAPAAVYTRDTTTLQGTSTYVQGRDQCGTGDVYGTLTMKNVIQNGNPFVDGVPQPISQNSPINIDVQGLINQFKSQANYTYNVTATTMAGVTWGTPTLGATQQDAMSCTAQNVVYINTNNTFVQLTGMSNGCGLLLVEGDLLVNGGLHWYGVILASGSIAFTGGAEKNVTGAVLAGANASADLVGGNTNILYCSQAVYNNSHGLPLHILRWAELFE
jgi:Tfp pilus assembly protein PilX